MPDIMELTPGSQIGAYRILGLLGRGAMGEVYRARDTRLEREVAVKVLPAQFAAEPRRLQRFEQEARAAGSLSHPAIPVLYDVGTHEGMPFLVSEVVDGETLRALVAKGPLPERRVCELGAQIARGLAAAHAKGIVHRDLKPENLMLARDGHAKILDFGLAKLTQVDGVADAGSTATDAGLSLTGAVLGTASYMAPEQVRGETADHRADIFALGSVLHELLGGQRAFPGRSAPEAMAAILYADPQPFPEGRAPKSTALAAILERCLEKDPMRRFQSAADLAFALERVDEAPPRRPARTARFAGSRGNLLLAAAIIALIAAGVAVGRSGRGIQRIQYERLTYRRGMVASARFGRDQRTVYYAARWGNAPQKLRVIEPGQTNGRDVPNSDHAALVLCTPSGDPVARVAGLSRPGHPGDFSRSELRVFPRSGEAPHIIAQSCQSADLQPRTGVPALARRESNWDIIEYPPGKVVYRSLARRINDVGGIPCLRFSPDGSHLAFEQVDWRGSGRITIIDLSNGELTHTQAWSNLLGLAWDPRHHSTLLFTAAATGRERKLYSLDIRRGKPTLVGELPGGMTLFDVARDGAVLAAREQVANIMLYWPADAPPRDLSWLDGSVPTAITPDGERLVFFEGGTGGGPDQETFVCKVDGDSVVSLGAGRALSLSSDGSTVLVALGDERPRLFTVSLATGERQAVILDSTLVVRDANFCPNGQIQIWAERPQEAVAIYLVTDPTGHLRRIGPPDAVMPFFSPDMQRVIYRFNERPDSIVSTIGAVRPVKPWRGSAIGWEADGAGFLTLAGGSSDGWTISRVDASTWREEIQRVVPPPPQYTRMQGVEGYAYCARTRAFVLASNQRFSELFIIRGLLPR